MADESVTQVAAAPVAPTAAPPRRIFTATMVIGVTGSGKTSLADGFSMYLWETYRKILLLYSWDGGAIPTNLQKRMKQGLVRFFRARTRSAAGLGIETLYLSSRGYFPESINPDTGEVAPAVQMVAPLATKYISYCPQGHQLQSVPRANLIQSLLCPQCKQIVPVAQQKIDEHVERARGFDQVGGVFFDGLTSMSQVVMEHMDHARGEGQIGGEKSSFGGVVTSGSVKLGGSNRADIGFAQSRAQQFVNASLSIPYLVEGPVFTALTMEATDEGGLPIVGAKLPGRAATDEVTSWVGNAMEMGKTMGEDGVERFTLFLRPFTDKQGRRHLLKTSASPTGVPDKLTDPASSEGKPFTIANLGNVYRLLDQDLADSLQEELPGGGPAVPSSYGEPMRVERVAQPASSVGQAARPTAGVLGIQPIGGVARPLATAAGLITPEAPGTTTVSSMPMMGKPKPAAVPVPQSQTPPVASQATPPAAVPSTPSPVASAAAGPPPAGSPPQPPGMRPPAKLPGK